VMSKGGERLPLNLTPENVQQLVSTGRARVQFAGLPLDFTVTEEDQWPAVNGFEGSNGGGLPGIKVPGMTLEDIVTLGKKLASKNPHFVHPYMPDKDSGLGPQGSSWGGKGGSAGGTTALATPSMTDKVQPRLPTGSGLPVAVFVPWKQTWTLKGFSRGNLLHTIALAPQEQITMQVFSWERKSRSLDQSSETETDQQTDVTQTTRDTEDVFKEMISKHDFAWQISGSIDASYNPGVASIRVSASGA